MKRTVLLLLLVAAVVLSGCATKKYVRTEAGAVEERVGKQVDEVKGEVGAARTRLDEQATKHDRDVAELSKTAREALDRAIAAGKLAEGKFLYETVLTDEMVRFARKKVKDILATHKPKMLDADAAERVSAVARRHGILYDDGSLTFGRA